MFPCTTSCTNYNDGGGGGGGITNTSSSSSYEPLVPTIETLALVSALYNPQNHALHVQAIQVRDQLLVGGGTGGSNHNNNNNNNSLIMYYNICCQLLHIFIGSDQPYLYLLSKLNHEQIELWQQTGDQITIQKLVTFYDNENPNQNHTNNLNNNIWIPFGQLAGLMLKNALLHPPPPVSLSNENHHHHDTTTAVQIQPYQQQLQMGLLFALQCQHKELRDVASTIIATTFVLSKSITTQRNKINNPNTTSQLLDWTPFIPQLLYNLQVGINHHNNISLSTHSSPFSLLSLLDGTFSTLRKMMEDGGPSYFTTEELDTLIPLLLQYLIVSDVNNNHHHNTEKYHYIISSLQIICTCLQQQQQNSSSQHQYGIPNSLVLHFDTYLQSLSTLASIPIDFQHTTTTSSSSSSTISGGLSIPQDNHNNNHNGSSSGSAATNHHHPIHVTKCLLQIRKWVCRSIVTILDSRTEFLHTQFQAVTYFMLETTNVVQQLQNQYQYYYQQQVQHQQIQQQLSTPNTFSVLDELLLLRTEMDCVALEATDYWLTFSNQSNHDNDQDDHRMTNDMYEVVRTILPRLVPILVQNMIYPNEKQQQLLHQNQYELEQQQQSQQQVLKPIFHKKRGGGGTSSKNHDQPASKRIHKQQHTSMDNHIDDDDEDDEDEISSDGEDDDEDDDDDDDDDDGNEWTLRKCSAASLDSLANLFGGSILLPCILPIIQEGFSNPDPFVQEATVLAFGAIAEGCQDELIHLSFLSRKEQQPDQNYMKQIHEYLLGILAQSIHHYNNPTTTPSSNHILPQLKSIVAWTIGQYSSWAVEQVQNNSSTNHNNHHNNHNNHENGQLLAHMTDLFVQCLNQEVYNKVQFACCAAFGVLIETAGDLMAPYLEHIYTHLINGAFRIYTGRSLLSLFDLFGILADCCGQAIAENNLTSIYIPPLIQRWNQIATKDPTDRTLLPLMECLASITVACQMNYQPYALETLEFAIAIIEQVILTTSSDSTERGGRDMIEENYDPIICAADLIDGLIEALKGNFFLLLSSSTQYGPQFLNILLLLCQHDVSGVRVSALAILGDLAVNAPMVLEPALPQLLYEAVQNMDPINPSVATNAVWAVGEICTKCIGNSILIKPYAPDILQNLISLLVGNGADGDHNRYGNTHIPGLAENASSCVGRLALVDPNFVAPDLSRFLLGWCDGLVKISDPIERRDAFQGFVQVVYANPNAIQTACPNVFDTIASILFTIFLTWHLPPEQQQQHFHDAAASNGQKSSSSMSLYTGEYRFQPFPVAQGPELGQALKQFVRDMMISVGTETWMNIEKQLPVNFRRLLREEYYDNKD